jgi:YjbE family integral membrane protein
VDFLLNDLFNVPFWIAAGQIIGVNVILSGDNAVVIALACMHLPPKQRLWGMILGAGVAVLLRVIFTLVVSQAMEYPALKFVGGLLLLWVAVKLVVPEEEGGEKVEAAETLWRAVRIVAIADIVMSLDNVIAVAAAAKGSFLLLALGIAISIPPVVIGSTVMLWALDRFPILAVLGSGLLGWIAGELAVEDSVGHAWVMAYAPMLEHGLRYVTCAIVLAVGFYLRRRATTAASAAGPQPPGG